MRCFFFNREFSTNNSVKSQNPSIFAFTELFGFLPNYSVPHRIIRSTELFSTPTEFWKHRGEPFRFKSGRIRWLSVRQHGPRGSSSRRPDLDRNRNWRHQTLRECLWWRSVWRGRRRVSLGFLFVFLLCHQCWLSRLDVCLAVVARKSKLLWQRGLLFCGFHASW